MKNPRFDHPDGERSRQRSSVATLERELWRVRERLPADQSESLTGALFAAFNQLSEQLALGPEPELRECPVCKHLCMRAASRCGQCWTALAPLGASGHADAMG